MTSNLLLALLIFTNSIIAIYLAYKLIAKMINKCKQEDIDPFSDTEIYYKKLIGEQKEQEMEPWRGEIFL